MIIRKHHKRLKEMNKKGFIQGLGAGLDYENGKQILYIQTTNDEMYDKLNCSFGLYYVYNPSDKDIQNAKKELKELSNQYKLPISWNHL